MKYKRIGNSGLFVTEITFGTALTIGTETNDVVFIQNLIDAAWDLGIRSFDTSNNYGLGRAEVMLGVALKKYPRESFVLSTKGSWPLGSGQYEKGLGRKHIYWAFQQSLERLKLDYVDIYYAHRYDACTPMEEIVRTFGALLASGRVLYWATSEWPLDALIECHETCERLGVEKPILDQFVYSYAINKAAVNGVKNFCEKNAIGMLGFAPLCQGLLTGKYAQSIPANSRIAKSEKIGYDKTKNIYGQFKDRIDYFNNLCIHFNVKGSHAAIQWVLNQGVLPVLGASSAYQLAENISALDESIPTGFWDSLNAYEL